MSTFKQTMLQEVLKQSTKKNHDELEQLMFVNEIMNGTLSVHQYKQILSTNFVVHKTFEDFLFNNLSPKLAERLNINRRRKQDALLKDLMEMGIPITGYDYQPVTLSNNSAAILGALYVLEGATLGGSVIVKKLKTNPNFTELNLGFHYYRVYGNELVNYWKQICLVLNEQPEESYPTSVDGAITLFDYIAATQQKNNDLVNIG